jgi:PST family polysaccharide transporter
MEAVAAVAAPTRIAELDRSFLRSLAWSGGAKWGSQIVSWISTIIVARILVPEDYGLVSMAMVFVGFVALLSEFGVGTAVIALPDLRDDQIAQLNSLAVLTGAAACLVTCAAAVPLGRFFENPTLPYVLIALSVGFIITSLATVPAALLQRDLQFRDLALIDGLRAILTAAVTAVLALLGFGFWTLVVSSVFSSVLGSALLLVRRRHRLAWPDASLRSAIRLSWHLIVNRVCWYVYSNADFAIAGRVLGQAALGSYSLAWTLTSIPIEKVTSLATAVTPAYLAAVRNDRELLRRYLLKPTGAIALIAFPLLAGLAIVAPDAVGFVLGHKWDGAVVPLQILALYGCVRSLTPLLPPFLIMTGESSFLMWNSIAYALVMPVSFYVGTYWGLTGVAFAWVVAYPAVTIPMYRRVFERLELPARDYLASIAPALCCAALMAVAALAFRTALGNDLTPPVRLTGTVGAGGVVYLASMVFIFRERFLTWLTEYA